MNFYWTILNKKLKKNKMYKENKFGRGFVSGKILSIDTQNNIKMLHNKGYKTNEISKIERIHYNTTKKYLIENRINKRRKWTLIYNPKNIILFETMIELYPTMNNKEKSKIFKNITGHNIDPSYICKIQKKLGYKRKRISPVALQRSTKRIIYLRKEFAKTMLCFNYKRFLFIDEVHVTSKDTSVAYGYFKNSELRNNFVSSNFFHKESYSFIVAMDYTGIKTIYYKDTRNKGVNADDFIRFLDLVDTEDSVLFIWIMQGYIKQLKLLIN